MVFYSNIREFCDGKNKYVYSLMINYKKISGNIVLVIMFRIRSEHTKHTYVRYVIPVEKLKFQGKYSSPVKMEDCN